ncbi:unnamed protein product [Lactuca saligna]|uniref:TFIIS N-terminal domain-containing protein n=1 Tax=Lactuca saligna TaxID=75948 RepID=A0AA35Z243_LACSI|nr:unnamed protein product [Lactuca saligna]
MQLRGETKSPKNSTNRQPLLAGLGRCQFSDSSDDYAKRNYANNVSEYNTIVGSLTSQRRLKEPWNTGTSTILVIMAQTREPFMDKIVQKKKQRLFHKRIEFFYNRQPDVRIYRQREFERSRFWFQPEIAAADEKFAGMIIIILYQKGCLYCSHVSDFGCFCWTKCELRSIVSKQVGPTEQAQGCITCLCSFASIVSPLIFNPLTALFLFDNAPFEFPSFILVCASFAVFPIHLDQYDRKEQLKKSGLAKAIMFLSKSDEETTSNRKLAKALVDKGVKSFKFHGAFPVLLEMGVLPACSLESMSSLDMEGLCALGDGHILNFLLNTSTWELTDRKKVSLRKELRMLSHAARDVGPIREAKNKLEK